MATFCSIDNCNNLSFRRDKNTNKPYCSNHYKYYSTDLDRRSIQQKALSKGKVNKPTKELRFQPVKKIRPGTFDESVVGKDCVGELELVDETKGIDESLVNLSNDLDFVLSQYIRYKNADKDGNCTCFTCGIVLPIKKMQNGHYKKRSHKATRFLEQNCRCQCEQCNVLHNTDETPYKNALEAEYSGITDWLDEQAATVYKATRTELKQTLIEYRGKLEILKRIYE